MAFQPILEGHSQPGTVTHSKNKAKKPLIAERLFFLMIVFGGGTLDPNYTSVNSL